MRASVFHKHSLFLNYYSSLIWWCDFHWLKKYSFNICWQIVYKIVSCSSGNVKEFTMMWVTVIIVDAWSSCSLFMFSSSHKPKEALCWNLRSLTCLKEKLWWHQTVIELLLKFSMYKSMSSLDLLRPKQVVWS